MSTNQPTNKSKVKIKLQWILDCASNNNNEKKSEIFPKKTFCDDS